MFGRLVERPWPHVMAGVTMRWSTTNPAGRGGGMAKYRAGCEAWIGENPHGGCARAACLARKAGSEIRGPVRDAVPISAPCGPRARRCGANALGLDS